MDIYRPRPRRTRALTTGLAVLATIGLAACGGDDGDSAVAAPADDQVTIRLIAFRPENIAIDAGDSVTWVQEDIGAHTVTSGTVDQGSGGVTVKPDGKFDSGDIASGMKFRFTFDAPGTYPYFCDIHPATMRGAVEVR
jgi:plastocyanin